MPNWCSTTLEVRGSESEVNRFMDGVKKDDGRIDIMDSYYPCPQELKETVSGWSNDEAIQAEREAREEANKDKYGYRDWYDWCNANWGTKWGDCDTILITVSADEVSHYAKYGYQTAWSPATNGFLHISKMFPTLTFVFEHDEEGGFYAGMEVIANGEVVFVKLYEPSGYDGDLDWENLDSVDAYEEWKILQMDAIYSEYVEAMKEHYPSQANA